MYMCASITYTHICNEFMCMFVDYGYRCIHHGLSLFLNLSEYFIVVSTYLRGPGGVLDKTIPGCFQLGRTCLVAPPSQHKAVMRFVYTYAAAYAFCVCRRCIQHKANSLTYTPYVSIRL